MSWPGAAVRLGVWGARCTVRAALPELPGSSAREETGPGGNGLLIDSSYIVVSPESP